MCSDQSDWNGTRCDAHALELRAKSRTAFTKGKKKGKQRFEPTKPTDRKMAKTSGVRFWSESETNFMLNELKEANILKYMDGRKTRNGDLFKKVAEQMDGAGFKRTPEQVRVRWKHMKQAYYHAKRNNATCGQSPVSCPHEDILEELLGHRPLSQAAGHGVPIGSGIPVSDNVQDTEGNQEDLSSLPQRSSSPGCKQERASTPCLDFPRRPSGRRRRQVSDMDRFMQQMQQMQNAWREQFQQSQEREERLVQSILRSNESVVSTLMEGIRTLHQSVAPNPSQVPQQQMDPRYPAAEDHQPVYHNMLDCFLSEGQYKRGFASRMKLKDGSVPPVRDPTLFFKADTTSSSSGVLNVVKDVASQTDPPQSKSVGTQLSVKTLQNHFQSKGTQTISSSRDCGVGTTTFPLDSPLLFLQPTMVKRPRLTLKQEEEDTTECSLSVVVCEPEDSTRV